MGVRSDGDRSTPRPCRPTGARADGLAMPVRMLRRTGRVRHAARRTRAGKHVDGRSSPGCARQATPQGSAHYSPARAPCRRWHRPSDRRERPAPVAARAGRGPWSAWDNRTVRASKAGRPSCAHFRAIDAQRIAPPAPSPDRPGPRDRPGGDCRRARPCAPTTSKPSSSARSRDRAGPGRRPSRCGSRSRTAGTRTGATPAIRGCPPRSTGSCRRASRRARSNGRRRTRCRPGRWSTTATKARSCTSCR